MRTKELKKIIMDKVRAIIRNTGRSSMVNIDELETLLSEIEEIE